jgi:hypothetical protein
MRAVLLLWLPLFGCGSDVFVTEKGRCDGQLQETEGGVDEPFDSDGDGFFDGANPDCGETYPADRLDCDDGDPAIHPGAAELGCNGIDDDCDEATEDDADGDGDGVGVCADCADGDPTRRPGAAELGCNGIDDDCDEATPDEDDADGDGASSCEDCDDGDSNRAPGRVEILCNDIDDDCDAATVDALDADLDGASSCEDCDDDAPDVHPGALEVPCTGIDEDCEAATPDAPDLDADGWSACEDCDEGDTAVSPGAEELCDNGIDDDCDDEIDELCDVSYSDSWTLDDTIQYSCVWGLVSVNFSKLNILDARPDITVAPPSGSQPGTMSGSFTGTTTFTAENILTGSCDEIYTIEGEFPTATTLSGTLSISFVGTCFDCTAQSFPFTGSR